MPPLEPVRVSLVLFSLCEPLHFPPFGIDISRPTRFEHSVILVEFGLSSLVHLALGFSLLLIFGGEFKLALENSSDGLGGDSEAFGEDGSGVASGIGLLEELDEGDGFAGESLRGRPAVGEFILECLSLEEPLGWIERFRFGATVEGSGRVTGVGEGSARVVAGGQRKGSLFREDLLEHAFWTGE